MRYFLHIFTGSQTIADPEGAEFDDLAGAEAEAVLSARDLIAEELRCGRPFPRHWQARLAAADGAVLRSISFASLMDSRMEPPRPPSAPEEFSALYARVRATADRSHRITEEIQATVGDIRSQLRALAAHRIGR